MSRIIRSCHSEIDLSRRRYLDKPFFINTGDMDIFQLDDDGQQTDPAAVWQRRNVLQAFYFWARYHSAELVPRRERASSVAKLGFQGPNSPVIARGELWSPHACPCSVFRPILLPVPPPGKAASPPKIMILLSAAITVNVPAAIEYRPAVLTTVPAATTACS